MRVCDQESYLGTFEEDEYTWEFKEKKGTLQISHKAWIQWNVFDKLFAFIFVRLFPDGKTSTLTNWKTTFRQQKELMENSQPSLLSVNTYSTSPNFPLTLPCLTEKQQNTFLGGKKEEEVREEERGGKSLHESRSVSSTCPSVRLSDSCCYHTAETQVRWCTWSVKNMQVDETWTEKCLLVFTG